MIGLPTETDEDLESIRDLTLQMRDRMLKHARSRGRLGRIIGSVNPLIPKPGTAFQWLPWNASRIPTARSKHLRRLMAGIDNVYFTIKSERHSYYQALLSLGDRRVAPAIVAAERNGGKWRAAVEEDRRRRRRLHLPRPEQGRHSAVGHHRRRPESSASSATSSTKSMRAEWTLPPKRARENASLIPVIPDSDHDRPIKWPRPSAARTPRTASRINRRTGSPLLSSFIARSNAYVRRSPCTKVRPHRELSRVRLCALRFCRGIEKPISRSPLSTPSSNSNSASANFCAGVAPITRHNLHDHPVPPHHPFPGSTPLHPTTFAA